MKTNNRCWQLQEAKNRLSELVQRATTEGPQVITVRGKETAVVISVAEYERLTQSQPEESLLDLFRRAPLWASGIDLERQDDYGREIDL